MLRFFKKKHDLSSQPRSRNADSSRELNSEPGQFAFRRNQTLTGSASSRVRSPGETNAHIKSPRVHVHALAAKRRYLGFMLFVAIAAASLLYGLLSQFTARAVLVASADASLRLDASYVETMDAYFQERPVERLRFLTDLEQLQKYMQMSHPEIKAISASGAAGFGASRYTVGLREPIAGWTINGRQQFVDATGVAFAKNYFRSPPVQILDKSGVQIAVGQAVASNRFLGFVGQVVGMAGDRGYQASKVTIPFGTTRQIELQLKEVSYPIKLSVDRPAGEQVEDMARAIEWMQKNRRSPQYLDMRVSGKAFYRD